MEPACWGTLARQVLGSAGKHRPSAPDPCREVVPLTGAMADMTWGGPGPTGIQPWAWLWSGRVGTRGLCAAAPTGSVKGPQGTLIPFVLIPGEGGAEA